MPVGVASIEWNLAALELENPKSCKCRFSNRIALVLCLYALVAAAIFFNAVQHIFDDANYDPAHQATDCAATASQLHYKPTEYSLIDCNTHNALIVIPLVSYLLMAICFIYRIAIAAYDYDDSIESRTSLGEKTSLKGNRAGMKEFNKQKVLSFLKCCWLISFLRFLDYIASVPLLTYSLRTLQHAGKNNGSSSSEAAFSITTLAFFMILFGALAEHTVLWYAARYIRKDNTEIREKHNVPETFECTTCRFKHPLLVFIFLFGISWVLYYLLREDQRTEYPAAETIEHIRTLGYDRVADFYNWVFLGYGILQSVSFVIFAAAALIASRTEKSFRVPFVLIFFLYFVVQCVYLYMDYYSKVMINDWINDVDLATATIICTGGHQGPDTQMEAHDWKTCHTFNASSTETQATCVENIMSGNDMRLFLIQHLYDTTTDKWVQTHPPDCDPQG
jgi:hypothetical protein